MELYGENILKNLPERKVRCQGNEYFVAYCLVTTLEKACQCILEMLILVNRILSNVGPCTERIFETLHI